jgi:hypothetical protein
MHPSIPDLGDEQALTNGRSDTTPGVDCAGIQAQSPTAPSPTSQHHRWLAAAMATLSKYIASKSGTTPINKATTDLTGGHDYFFTCWI